MLNRRFAMLWANGFGMKAEVASGVLGVRSALLALTWAVALKGESWWCNCMLLYRLSK